MEKENDELAKQILVEILDYYKYKIDNNLTTMAEVKSVTKMLQENMDMYGTIPDLADFYGMAENQVRSTIAKKLIAKPVRRVMYPFHAFMKIVPEKWHTKRASKCEEK